MSKRIIKNIVMIILIVALCAAMYFTVNGQRKDFADRDEMMQKMSENGEMPSMPENGEKPEGMGRGQRNSENNTVDGAEMAEMPSMPEGENGEAPELPDGENMAKPEDGNMPEMSEDRTMSEGMQRGGKQGNMPGNNTQMGTLKIVLCAVEALGISVLSIYLILSKFNKLSLKETFENKSNIGSFIVLVILVTAIITMLVMLLNKNNKGSFEGGRGGMMPMEQETEKTTKAEDVDAGENVNAETINLNEHDSNITISEAGTYTLTGEFGYTVLVDADGDVTLNLNNAKIENETTAALANLSTNSLTINLLEGTTNTFSDGGSSDYDSCVFSNGPITIKGNGYLEVFGNQEDGEGIATKDNPITIDGGNIKIVSNDDALNTGGDGGTIKINDGNVYIKASGDGIDSNKNIVINGGSLYTMGSSKGGDAGLDADDGITINGGEIIALGSDMLEKPLNDSKQKAIVKNLSTTIASGSEVVLKDSEGNEVMSFTADDSFKTIILSSSKLETGKYNLYNGESLVEELECE